MSMVRAFFAMGCMAEPFMHQPLPFMFLEGSLHRGFLTHSVVLDQKFEIFNGGTLAAFEDGREILRVWNKVLGSWRYYTRRSVTDLYRKEYRVWAAYQSAVFECCRDAGTRRA